MNESALPPGWSVARLRDVAVPGGTRNPRTEDKGEFLYVDIDALDNSQQKIVTPKRIPNSEAPSRARMRIHEGDVLFSLVRPYLKNIAVVPHELDGQIASTAYCVLRSAEDIVSSFVFYYLMQDSFIHSVPTYGTSPPSARDEEFLDLEVPIAPFHEQRRIVEKIEELFSKLNAGVAALQRARADLKCYRAAVLKAAAKGKLTEEWRVRHPGVEPGSVLLERSLQERRREWEEEQFARYAKKGQKPPANWRSRYREPKPPDTSDLPELPDGWCWATLPQLGIIDRGRSRHRPRNAPHLYGGPYPFIQTGDVKQADTFIREHSQTYSESGLAQSKLWPAGTLCITIAANIAESAILAFDSCFPDSVVGFLAYNEKVSTRFVQLFLETAKHELEADAPATAQKNINIETLNALPVPLPSPEEQVAIVEEVDRRLSVIRRAGTEAEGSVQRAGRLQQSIIKRAFEGKLVPQDSTDEPASALLQRIAAARATTRRQSGTSRTSRAKRRMYARS